MKIQNPLDPDAAPFTLIDLERLGARRAHPDGPEMDDGLPIVWIEQPTPADYEQAVLDSLVRAETFEANPDTPVGTPGAYHLVHLYGGNYTTGALFVGYDLVRIPLCRHGLMPAVTVEFRDGTPPQRFEYVDAMGAYYAAQS